jgi:putative transposase
MELDVPHDRNGEFEPKIIKKYQNTLTQDMEEKIISVYAKGMATGVIESHMQKIYGVDISDSTISRITDKITPHRKRLARTTPGRYLCSSFYV